jgi:catechol 2,3-dioxygenase-like lactoylglutathione lyase family enzyme
MIGVPNVEDTCKYYSEFGLTRDGAYLSTTDGGAQLHIVERPSRRLVELSVGADDADDLDRVAAALGNLGIESQKDVGSVRAKEIYSGIDTEVRVLPRIPQVQSSGGHGSDPGPDARANHRAPGILREGPIRPRKLGHVVVGTPDASATQRFFTSGIGFAISDEIRDTATFLRCSSDHHNLLIQRSPVAFLHHTSWQVDDIDEVGRGAMRMLEGHPDRHVWGLGRHSIGSNFFWYLRDPAGNFSEYSSDMDTITDDQIWKPGTWEPSLRSLYAWGPDVPPSMLEPEDLSELMVNAHRG